MSLEFHPIADAFPLMNERELAELTADIKANGLKTEIDLYQGKILDGRNRYRACQAAGVVVRTRNFAARDEEHAISFAISANLKRKQYSKSRLEAAAAELANMKRGAPPGNANAQKTNPQKCGIEDGQTEEGQLSTKAAADKLGVKVRNVQKAAAIKKADPETFQAIKDGKISTGAAEKKVKARRPSKKTAKGGGFPPGDLERLPPGSRPAPLIDEFAESLLKSFGTSFFKDREPKLKAVIDHQKHLKPEVRDNLANQLAAFSALSIKYSRQLKEGSTTEACEAKSQLREHFEESKRQGGYLAKVREKLSRPLAELTKIGRKHPEVPEVARETKKIISFLENGRFEEMVDATPNNGAAESGVEVQSKAMNAILPCERGQLPAPDGNPA